MFKRKKGRDAAVILLMEPIMAVMQSSMHAIRAFTYDSGIILDGAG